MKKTIFKLGGVFFIATVMFVNVQFLEEGSDSKLSLTLASLENVAHAFGEDDDNGNEYPCVLVSYYGSIYESCSDDDGNYGGFTTRFYENTMCLKCEFTAYNSSTCNVHDQGC